VTVLSNTEIVTSRLPKRCTVWVQAANYWSLEWVGWPVTSAEHWRFLAFALSRPPEQIAADTAKSLAAVCELDPGVWYAVVAPTCTPIASACTHAVSQHQHPLAYTREALWTETAVIDCPNTPFTRWSWLDELALRALAEPAHRALDEQLRECLQYYTPFKWTDSQLIKTALRAHDERSSSARKRS